ncbi:MAG: HAMP domain-containing sensor histidine kinase [Kiritimatiellia bacterium]|nr:HAMP domain-containing sensor histidine kinase [Kiritimatiellia bacterium]
MKARTLFLVLLLLLLPTLLLTFMAGRSLRYREMALQIRTKTSALDAIREVSRRVEVHLNSDMVDLRMSVSDALSGGGGVENIDGAVKHLRETRTLVGDIYVFMNPWGFVYPQEETVASPVDEAAETQGGEHDELIQVLRREIASAEVWSDAIRVTVKDASYCFLRISENRGLYVGFEVDGKALMDLLRRTLRGFSGGGITLRASGPGIGEAPELSSEGAVTVTDTLGEDIDALEVSGSSLGGVGELAANSGKPIAVGRLQPPFDFVRIAAFITDPEYLQKSRDQRLRLQTWGIALLALAMVAGVWLVLKETSYEIKEARSRSDFVVGVSHDLRTPVSSMKVLTESLLHDRVPDKDRQKQFLETIVRECERLHQLIERVLFFVRFGQNALVFRPKPTDPGELLESTVASFRARFAGGSSRESSGREKLNPTVTLHLPEELPTVEVDPVAITEVVLNLLDNAYKYSYRGVKTKEVPTPQIDVALERTRRKRWYVAGDRPFLRIEVRDHGIGIDRENLRRVFHKFYRAPGANRTNVSGVGLGLALCRHVMKAHGGWIEADSEPGKGSAFSLLIPLPWPEM